MSKKRGSGGGRQAEGADLKRMREAVGMTQDDAARILGIKALAVSRKERGVSAFTPLERETLMAAYRERAGGTRPDAPAPPPDATKPAPVTAGGLEQLRGERHSAEWWAGYQRAALFMLEQIGAMHQTAIEMHREIADKTRPQPVPRQPLPMRKVDTDTPRKRRRPS